MRRYNARWIVPVSTPPLRDGTVAVQGGRIAYVGPRAGAPPGEDCELGDALLLPGLINAHTHLELTTLRGFLEGFAFRDWVATLQRAKVAVLDEDRLLDAARAGIAEGLRAGITCYADTCDSGVAIRAMREAGVRGIMYQEVFGPAPGKCHAALEELARKIAAHLANADSLRQVGVSPHAPYTVSDVLYTRVARYAASERLPIAIHIAESVEEHALVCEGKGPFADAWRARGIAVETRGRSPIQLMERLGMLGRHTLAIHCVNADESDIALLSRSDTAIAHCPISNAKLGHGAAPVDRFLAAGLRVGLGSDSMASNNRMHMLEEARAAVLSLRIRMRSASELPAALALELATLGGARALGLEARIGSLEPGKDADMAAFPLGAAAPAAEHDPAVAAVWSLGNAVASLVTVQGTELVRDSRILSDDPARDDRVRDTARALHAWKRNQGMSSV